LSERQLVMNKVWSVNLSFASAPRKRRHSKKANKALATNSIQAGSEN
jgi:hypothetical protein